MSLSTSVTLKAGTSMFRSSTSSWSVSVGLSMWLCRTLSRGLEPLEAEHQARDSLSPTSLAYNDSIQAQKNDVCRPGRYYEQPDNGVLNYPKRACQFNRTQLGDCSGIGDPTHYGYSTGQPCVFIKMNRVSMSLVPREQGGGSSGHHLLTVASFYWG